MTTATLRFSKTERLYRWCLEQKTFSTVDVRQWGAENFMLNPEVRIREFCRDPHRRIERIDPIEATLEGLHKEGSAPVAWYRVA